MKKIVDQHLNNGKKVHIETPFKAIRLLMGTLYNLNVREMLQRPIRITANRSEMLQRLDISKNGRQPKTTTHHIHTILREA